MRRKTAPDHAAQHGTSRDRWMVSYMDVLTILLIFFVAAAAQTTLPQKATQQTPPQDPHPQHELLSTTQVKLEPLHLDLKLDARGLVISLPQTILYASGDDEISDGARPMVAKIAAILCQIPNKISLEGHTDPVPIHNRRFRSNWELAAARSLRLLELLSQNDGIDQSRLSVASYGSFDPRESNDTPDGRAINRRVDIVVLYQQIQFP